MTVIVKIEVEIEKEIACNEINKGLVKVLENRL